MDGGVVVEGEDLKLRNPSRLVDGHAGPLTWRDSEMGGVGNVFEGEVCTYRWSTSDLVVFLEDCNSESTPGLIRLCAASMQQIVYTIARLIDQSIYSKGFGI